MRRAPKITRGMLALVTALLAGGVPAGPAAAGDDLAVKPVDDGTIGGGAAAYRAVFPQMSGTAALAAFVQQQARKQVSEQAAADAGTFGGSWFDPPSGVMHVAVTEAGAESRAAQAAGRLGVRLQVHVVARSYAALERQAAALRTGAGALSRAASGRVGIDVAANQVVAAVPPGARAPLGKAPVGVRVVEAAASHSQPDSACSSRLLCDATIRSGAMLGFYGIPICSVGFTARDANNQRYVYTAGHCNVLPGPWSVGTAYIGPVTDSEQSGPVDAAIIRVDNSSFADDTGGEIYEENAGHSVPLDGVAPAMSFLQEGEVTCLAANYSDVNGPNLCGVIGSVSDPAESGMVRVDGLDACTGDSGGGWYWLGDTGHRIAYGVHSDSESGCHGDDGGSHSWFSPIPLITARWGLTTETAAR